MTEHCLTLTLNASYLQFFQLLAKLKLVEKVIDILYS